MSYVCSSKQVHNVQETPAAAECLRTCSSGDLKHVEVAPGGWSARGAKGVYLLLVLLPLLYCNTYRVQYCNAHTATTIEYIYSMHGTHDAYASLRSQSTVSLSITVF